MIAREITIINQLGLHARAAAQLVRLAGKYQSRITLKRLDNGFSANAKSILSVLTLAAPKGTILQLTVDGADENTAISAIEALVMNKFGEES